MGGDASKGEENRPNDKCLKIVSTSMALLR
jgi:hypothetical protein